MTKNLSISQIRILTVFLCHTFCYYSSDSFVASQVNGSYPSTHGKAVTRIGRL